MIAVKRCPMTSLLSKVKTKVDVQLEGEVEDILTIFLQKLSERLKAKQKQNVMVNVGLIAHFNHLKGQIHEALLRIQGLLQLTFQASYTFCF